MKISNLFIKVLLVVVMVTLSMSVDAQYNRRGGNNTSGNGTSMVEEAAKGVVNGVKGLFSKKDKAKDKDKKEKNKEKKKDKKGNDDFFSELSNSSKSEPLADDDIEVIASGDGTTKEQATLSALRSALEQTFGTFVSSNTQILNDELVKDEIVSISTGNVKHFEYLSDAEINGKNYVTVKAVVSIGRLVSYAKSKGSSAELAGSTFAMNVRMTRFRYENIFKAIDNLEEKAVEIFPYCFDFNMEGDLEPKQNRKGNYDVEFDVLINFNSNAKYLLEIGEQEYYLYEQYSKLDKNLLPNRLTSDIKVHSLRDILPKIFSQFKIVDNLNEMCVTDTLTPYYWVASKFVPVPYKKNKKKEAGEEMWYSFCKKNGERCGRLDYCPDERELACIYVEEIIGNKNWYDRINFRYGVILPSRPFMRFTVTITYTLEELEKITGIDLVVL